MMKMKRRVEMFRAGHVPSATQTRQLVDDLWQEYEHAVKRLRKISVRANDVGASCFRCGAAVGARARRNATPSAAC